MLVDVETGEFLKYTNLCPVLIRRSEWSQFTQKGKTLTDKGLLNGPPFFINSFQVYSVHFLAWLYLTRISEKKRFILAELYTSTLLAWSLPSTSSNIGMGGILEV